MSTARAIPSAVLMPFYRDTTGAPRLILIERTPHGRHGGQISLPGGKHEPSDATMRATAIRETCEELGLEPDALEVLDELPSTATRSTGYRVWPFVGRLRHLPDHWEPDQREVARVLDLAVADLIDPTAHGIQEMSFAQWNTTMTVPVWRVAGHTIWGLTLRVLEPVLPRVLAGEYPI